MASPNFQDRVKAAELRSRLMDEVFLILDDSKEAHAKIAKWSEMKKRIVEKMAANLLPRVNEHTGADGAELPVPIFNVSTNNGNSQSPSS